MSSRAPSTRGMSRSRLGRSIPPPPVRIGVGVDGHVSGRDAVVLASQLARASGGGLMLIAIYEEPLLEPIVPSEAGWRSARKEARAILATTGDSLAREARIVVDSNALVRRGLCRVSKREHRDLLVVGSGRRAGDGQVRLGERAQDLLYHLECPLAIAPRGMSNRDQPRLERIGVGFDDGPEARAALEWAGSLALGAGAQLEVRGVIDDRVPAVLVPQPGGLKGDAVVAERTKSILQRTLAASRATGAAVRVDATPETLPTRCLSLPPR
jgi:nucleotide-binding universal stress UspA family protein